MFKKLYLNEKEKIEVAKLLAEFRTPLQISRFVMENFKKDIPDYSVKKYFLEGRNKWTEIIDKFRAVYLSAEMSVPIAHKKVRLERYDDLYQKAYETGKFMAARACLDSAREEIEGSKTHIIGNVLFTQINNMSDDALKEEQQRILDKLEKLGMKPRREIIEAQTTEDKNEA